MVPTDSGFSVINIGTKQGVGLTYSTTTLVNGNTELILKFTGSGIIGGSLADGRYTLNYEGATLLNGTKLFRLFGDLYGTGSVTAADRTAMYAIPLNSRRGVGNHYNAAFDYDGDGWITVVDRTAFNQRYGKMLDANGNVVSMRTLICRPVGPVSNRPIVGSSVVCRTSNCPGLLLAGWKPARIPISNRPIVGSSVVCRTYHRRVYYWPVGDRPRAAKLYHHFGSANHRATLIDGWIRAEWPTRRSRSLAFGSNFANSHQPTAAPRDHSAHEYHAGSCILCNSDRKSTLARISTR